MLEPHARLLMTSALLFQLPAVMAAGRSQTAAIAICIIQWNPSIKATIGE